ncbi:MAG: hypothetical protein H3C60_05195, partial [Sphingomonadaceae bacterium]|nr:hypothetical protein [Sphingomonadaceae bacterium]
MAIDKITEALTRRVAKTTSRRSLLTLIGGAITGAAAYLFHVLVYTDI